MTTCRTNEERNLGLWSTCNFTSWKNELCGHTACPFASRNRETYGQPVLWRNRRRRYCHQLVFNQILERRHILSTFFSNHGSLKKTMRCLQFINYLHFRPDDDLFTIWDFVVVVVVVLLFLFCFFACVWVLLFFCFIFIRGTKRCSVRVWRKGRTHHKLFVSLYPNKQDVKTKLTSALCRTGPINPR